MQAARFVTVKSATMRTFKTRFARNAIRIVKHAMIFLNILARNVMRIDILILMVRVDLYV
jgi:hypothetical protein